MYKTPYERAERLYTAVGSPVRAKYKPILKNNELVLEEDGIQDVYAEIQAYAESTDINVLINRYLNGDSEALNQSSGVYIDGTEMPSDYREYLNIMADVRTAYERSDKSVDFFQFVENLLTPSMPKEELIEEVKEGEVNE